MNVIRKICLVSIMVCLVCASAVSAVRGQSAEDAFVVDGSKRLWMNRCEKALRAAGFEMVDANVRESVITATYNSLTLAGSIVVNFKQDGGQVKVVAKASGKEDNLYAALTNPSDELLAKFKKAFSAIKD